MNKGYVSDLGDEVACVATIWCNVVAEIFNTDNKETQNMLVCGVNEQKADKVIAILLNPTHLNVLIWALWYER